MSLNKPPSYVGIDEKKGTFTVAFISGWYDVYRCAECPQFKCRAQSTRTGFRTVAYCECMEAEEACEVTGKRYGEENDIETGTS